MPAGVLDVHPELLLGRRVVAEIRQPRRGTPAPAGRVDEEIGGEDLLDAAVRARPHPGARDPVPGRRGDQACYLALILDRDVGQRPDPVTDMGFQARPARQVRRLTGFAVHAQQVAAEDEPALARITQHRDAGRLPASEPNARSGRLLRLTAAVVDISRSSAGRHRFTRVLPRGSVVGPAPPLLACLPVHRRPARDQAGQGPAALGSKKPGPGSTRAGLCRHPGGVRVTRR